MFISAGAMETFAFAHSVGIGSINVAINLTQLVLKERPQNLIFIGSAGSYNKNCPLLSIIESTVASHIELSLCENKAYTPIDNMIKSVWQDDDVSCETSKPIVNSSDYITTDETCVKYFLERHIHYENMEFYAVLSVAKMFNIPAKGIFCITNHAHASAHKEFLNNFQASNKSLEQYVRQHYARYL